MGALPAKASGAASRRRGRLLLTAAFLAYLALSVLIWWRVWSEGAASHTICSCGDPALITWFLAWPAHAISHGLNPLYSADMLHPRGINLLSNTSALAAGVPLSPVTWLFGPVATANLANTLAPALSGLSMCWLLTRWVRSFPAAFAGGLLYGFSPFVFTDVAGSYISLSWLWVLPLLVACLEEALVRQQRRPVTTGVRLALLAVLQFFIGTEVLFTAVLIGAAAVALLLLVAGLAGKKEAVSSRLPHAAKALGTAVALSLVLLAYPIWFAVAGPAALRGAVWLHSLDWAGNPPWSFTDLGYFSQHFAAAIRRFGGYQGHRLPRPAALGPLLLAVLAGGWAVFWRDRRLGLFGAIGLLSAVLSLGVRHSVWTPWRLVGTLPVFENVVPNRFSIFVDLSAAVMFGLVLDHVHGALAARSRQSAGRLVSGGLSIGLACAALVPIVLLEAPDIPLTVKPVTLPRWFAQVAPRLPPGQVVLSYPSFSTQVDLAWNAADSISYAMVGGGGPAAEPARAGKERRGAALLTRESFPLGTPPALTPSNIAAVRGALRAWGVDEIVVPDQADLPGYTRGRSVPVVSSFFTGVLGRRPRLVDGSLVWPGVARQLKG